jgi:TIR domain/AbiTii
VIDGRVEHALDLGPIQLRIRHESGAYSLRMARIFISHSSHDKAVARKLVDDLRALGHEPWLDEYAIRVGDSIPGKIEEGLQNADFVAVLLSPAAVQSGWVDREWKAKYWAEVLADRVMVLPVLLEDCEIPLLLGPKKYADLRNYAVGLVQLIGAIDPSLSPVAGPLVVLQTPPAADEVAKLIAKVQSRAVPLSQCLAEALQLAIKLKDQSLQSLCNHELRGWKADTKPDDTPNYRKIEMFLSPTPINMNYLGFGGSASAALSYMQRSKDYKAFSMVVGEPISQIEARPPSDPDKGLLSVTLKWSDVQDNAPQPNATLYAYAPGDSYAEVLERIRTELTAQLLNLLPSVGQPPDR